MKLNKIFILVLLLFSFSYAQKDKVNINFKNLEIKDLIKITSKVINKNILITTNIKGKVDFISNKPVSTDDILNILIYSLESKGYTIVDNKGILRVVRLNDAAKYNRKVVNKQTDTYQIITEVFNVDHANVDYISSKIRHLMSASAKLVTDKESNAIVITDFAANIKTIKDVINLIAQDAQKYVEIIQLDNLQAATIQTELISLAKALYDEKIEKEKVSILANKDTNSIMIIGKKENVKYLSDYLEDIDSQGSLVAKSVEVIRLKNVESKNILTMLNGIVTAKKYKDPNDKPYVAADEESNAIILMGAKDEIGYFKKIINKLDTDRQQVYVQARIIEVNEDLLNDVGMKYGLQGFSANTKSGLATFSSSLNGGSEVATVDLNNLSMLGGLDPAAMKNGLSLGASINLLNQNGAADIVSEPSILCINNKASSIYVGSTKSIKTGTTTTTGGNVEDNYKREDIGLTLKIKPRISSGDKVSLEIETKLEEADETKTTNDQPDTYKRELTTTAIVTNGESVILGGYIKSKEGKTIDKVPLLGDIPLLGGLFRNTKEIKSKVNLVVIVTPYIIPKSKDLSYVRNQLSELKILEDRYTKNLKVRLEKTRLKDKIEDLEREKEKLIIDEAKEDFKEDLADFEEDKKEYFEDKENSIKEKKREEEQKDIPHHVKMKMLLDPNYGEDLF